MEKMRRDFRMKEEKIHIKFGSNYEYTPFKNERYVLMIKISKIIGLVLISLGSIIALLILILQGRFDGAIANVLFWITFIALVAVSVVSEKIPIQKEEVSERRFESS